MNALKEIINVVSSNQSGHWGIVADIGRKLGELDGATFRVLRGGRQVACLPLQCAVSGDLVNVDSRETIKPDGLYEQMKHLVLQAREDGRSVARCIVTRFENLPIEAQCSILRGSRAVRDETSNFTVQTIVTGAWNFFHVQQYWKEWHRNISPVPDRKHVFFQGRLTGWEIIGKFRAARLVTNDPGNFAEICAHVLVEATGGDAFLLEWIISALTTQHLPLEALESVLSQAVESGELTDELRHRTGSLDAGAWEILESILRYQFVARPGNDVHAENLRLRGFITSRSSGDHNTLSLRSQIWERVLREKWAIISGRRTAVVEGRDLARPSLALNTAAYQLVAQIEGTLRNLIVLELGGGSLWTEPLEGVKTLAHDGDAIATELLGLARIIQETLGPTTAGIEHPALTSKAVGEPITEPNPPQPVKRPKQISIVRAAEDWRQRNRQATALELSGDSLVYFFTSEGLSSVLVNEKQDIYDRIVKRFYPNKHELITFLESYVAIRAAVAHNQPLALITLKRLESMRCDLERRICQAEAVLPLRQHHENPEQTGVRA